jgi:CheY-like chemotaxis protein
MPRMPASNDALDAIRVLIVDDEVNLRFAIERGLRKAGHQADSASTVRQGIERLRTEPYDIVLCDLRMPSGDGEQLVQWLGGNSPSTRVVVMSAFVTPEFRREYEHSPVRILEKPVDLADLVRLLERIGPRRGFFGNSIEVELFDYVQMVAIAGRDKWIEVTTPLGRGHIWFEHGDVVHAEIGGITGEPAFYRMLSAGRGAFKEVFYRAPPHRTIAASATHLLMEAARMIDEGTITEAFEDPVAPEIVEDASSFADISAALSHDGSLGSESDPTDELLLDDDDESRDTLHLNPAGSGEGMLLADDDVPSRPPAVPPPPPPGGRARAVPPPLPPRPPSTRDPQAGLTRAGGEGPAQLEAFLGIEGVAGAAIISSTGKVLAEDMRGTTSLVTLAGFYLRGAARMARLLGDSVFDSIASRSAQGGQLVMVSMGVMTAVLAVAAEADVEHVRERALELAA